MTRTDSPGDWSRNADGHRAANNLAADFGLKGRFARQCLEALSNAIIEAEPPELGAWTMLVGRASGRDPAQPSDSIERLATSHGLNAASSRPEAVLFALHTYYATVVKLLLEHILAVDRADDPAGAQFPTTSESRSSPLGHDNLFDWPAASGDESLASMLRGMAARMATYTPTMFASNIRREQIGCHAHACRGHDENTENAPHVPGKRGHGTRPKVLPQRERSAPAEEGDPLGRLYQDMFPRALRHQLGEYYTPGWLAEHVLDAAGYLGEPDRRLLDPACGSGRFLMAAIGRIRRWRAANRDDSPTTKADLLATILDNVAGYELNPLAAVTARANYLLALGDLRPAGEMPVPPIWLGDSILDAPATPGRFDFVVGNPPWIAWDNLPPDYREATKPLWHRYGLFSLSGNAARHGGAKKDLAMLMIHVGADRFLGDGGRLAMVVTQTLFQSKGAGDGFRRFRLGPEGPPLKVLRVDDLVALRPFAEATNFTSTLVLEKGEPTTYPVPYIKWSPGNNGPSERISLPCRAEPIDSSQLGSPWFVRPEGFRADLSVLFGPSDYVAHIGANTGGANGVYWVEIIRATGQGVLVRNLAQKGRGEIERGEHTIEPDLLYPLLRWGDVGRYHARSSAHILLAQDPATRTGIDPRVMRRDYPATLAYIERHERLLRRRAAYRRYQWDKPFYSMYNVGPYTVSPIKVVWRRMDRRVSAAVVGAVDDPLLGRRPVIPQETCVLIATDTADEAHYLCAVLNSAVADFLVRSHSVVGGKGFGTPSLLDYLKLRRYDPRDSRHVELAANSRAAHAMAAEGGEPVAAQRRIDQLAAELWGLEESDLAAIGD